MPLVLRPQRFFFQGSFFTAPFNLHYFRPYFYNPHLPPDFFSLCCHFRLLRLHFLKLAHTGQNKCLSVTLSTFPEQGHKSAHKRSQVNCPLPHADRICAILKKDTAFLRCPYSTSITLSFSVPTTPAFLSLPCHRQALKSVQTLQ